MAETLTHMARGGINVRTISRLVMRGTDGGGGSSVQVEGGNRWMADGGRGRCVVITGHAIKE